MRDKAELSDVLAVLVARVRTQKTTYAKELSNKARLRNRQLDIIAAERKARDALLSSEVSNKSVHASRRLWLEKMRLMQDEIQPDLASAAAQRMYVKDALKKTLKQQIAVELQIARIEQEERSREDTSAVTFALYQAHKSRH